MCHCDDHKLSALQVGKPEQNTALNAKTEQFIIAKISGNTWTDGSRTHSVLQQRSLQLQKYTAAHYNSGVKHTQRYERTVHNCESIKLRESLVE